MGKRTLFAMLALTGVWVILMESISWQNVAVGMFFSMVCMHLIGKFFNFEDITDVAFYKLALYPLWLVVRIYADAFFMIRLIFGKAKWGVETYRLDLDSEVLRTILADSITLTPGSVYLEREEKDIVLLCIGDHKQPGYPALVSNIRAMERVLQKSVK